MCLNAVGKKVVISSQQVMQKDRNRQGHHKPDLSLPRSKILRGKKNFQRLFEKSTVLKSNSLHFRYRLYQNPDEGCFVGFIAPKKKMRGAVQRNRAKRLMREAYRLNQTYLQDIFKENIIGFHGAFIANKSILTYSEIENDVKKILTELRERLLKATSTKATKADSSSLTSNAEKKQS